MDKLYSILALGIAVVGCAAVQTDPAANVTEKPAMPPASVKTVDMVDFKDDRTRCENLTRRGTRIVVAQRCRPIDEDALADQLHQVGREQDELDRLARERESQRRGGGL
jgi:hypothetical protein